MDRHRRCCRGVDHRGRGFREATLAHFATDSHSYEEISVNEQVELLTLAGDITTGPDGYQLHAHAVCGRRDGSTIGGRIRRAVVRPALELVISQTAELSTAPPGRPLWTCSNRSQRLTSGRR